jgi:PAS domain S-box-containing protein
MTIERAIVDTLLATRSDAIIATDRDGLINIWNPGAVRIFGFSAEEVQGQSLDTIIPENLRARHWAGYHLVMETGKSRYGEGELLSVPAVTKAGKRISVEFTIEIVHDAQQQPAGTVAILRDVTSRFEELRALRRRLADAVPAN